MSTFEKLTNGNILYTDAKGVRKLSPSLNIAPDTRDENFLYITEHASNTTADKQILKLDWRDVTAPASISRDDLITQLTTDFFFNIESPSGGLIDGTSENYAALPPAANHNGEFWLVENGSGGLLSWIPLINVYKYPKGVYSPDSNNVWQITPFNVQVAEDALSILSISNWPEYFAFAKNINIGDRIIFNGAEYSNLTGNQTNSNPSIDTTNWERISVIVITTSTNIANALANTIYICKPTSTNITITIPNAVDNKTFFRFYKETSIDNHDVIITTISGTQLIGGSTSQIIYGENEGFSIASETDHYNITQDNRGAVQRKLSQSTMILDGFKLTIASATTINIASGIYLIEDATSLKNPISKTLRFPGTNNYSITGLNTQGYTRLLIDENGTIIQSVNTGTLSPESRRKTPNFGVVNHFFGSGNIESVFDAWTPGQNPSARLTSYMDSVGVIKKGFLLEANGANLQINVAEGILTSAGINSDLEPLNPDNISIPAQIPANLIYLTQTTVDRLDTLIDVANYNPAGSTISPIGGSGNDTAIHRVFITLGGAIVVQYGQNTYTSQNAAIEAFFEERDTFIENTILSGVSIKIGYIFAERTADNLSDLADARFLQTNRFGNSASSGAGSVSQSITSAISSILSPSTQQAPTNIETTIIFNNEEYDRNNEYDNTIGEFTANSLGIYSVCAGINISHNPGGLIELRLYKNGVLLVSHSTKPTTAGIAQLNVACQNLIEIGDTLSCVIYQITGQPATILSGTNTRFAITKIGN